MKIILSRKGFDSQYGGMPSPVFDRADMLSLPVPAYDQLTYDDLEFKGKTYAEIIKSLHKSPKINTCHLDPDIRKDAIGRTRGWIPAFGQCDAAEGHLRKQGVTIGDLFLFFGWFQHAKWNDGKPEFEDDRYGFHAIFGYLQVGNMVNLADGFDTKACHADHPHVKDRGRYKKSNMLYVASEKLSFSRRLPGAGPLKFHPGLVLTKKGERKTHWNLPRFFEGISYHKDASWKDGYFKSADKGQEFVVESNTEIEKWVRKVIEDV